MKFDKRERTGLKASVANQSILVKTYAKAQVLKVWVASSAAFRYCLCRSSSAERQRGEQSSASTQFTHFAGK